MVYSFTCPIEGCTQKNMTVDAATPEEAADKLTEVAKGHLATVHPGVVKSDDQVRSDITSMMVAEEV